MMLSLLLIISGSSALLGLLIFLILKTSRLLTKVRECPHCKGHSHRIIQHKDFSYVECTNCNYPNLENIYIDKLNQLSLLKTNANYLSVKSTKIQFFPNNNEISLGETTGFNKLQSAVKSVFLVALLACSSVTSAQQIILTSQEKFWVDANNCGASGPVGAWLSFTINNNTGSSLNNVKVTFSGFTGSHPHLFKHPKDTFRTFSSIAPGQKIPVYYYIDYSLVCGAGTPYDNKSANYSITVTSSSHATVVRNGTISTGDLLSANAAGIATSSTLSSSNIFVGQQFTQTVIYTFGNNSDLFFQPISAANFPDHQIRLIDSRITAVSGGVTGLLNMSDSLHFPNASVPGGGGSITVEYSWKSIGLNNPVTIRPYAAAKSGQKYKYSGLSASTIIPASTMGLSVQKTVNPSFLITPTTDAGFGNGIVEWTVQLINSTSNPIAVNKILDSIVPCMTMAMPIAPTSQISLANSESVPLVGTNNWVSWIGKDAGSVTLEQYQVPANSTINLVYRSNVSNCSSPSDHYNFARGQIEGINTNNASAKLTIGCVNPIISYPPGTFIASGSVAVTLDGLTGGTYSSSPAGLSINPNTGQINLTSSTPGVYDIEYTVNNGICIGVANTSITILPVPDADLSISKQVNNLTPTVGSNIIFTIIATNNGPGGATNAVVTDNLASGYSFVNATVSKGTYNYPNWNIGTLANGESATLTIEATVMPDALYTNTATVSATENDPNTNNNSSTVITTPLQIANLGVEKTVNNLTPTVSTEVTFTITATNYGPSNATGVVITDAIPAGYSVTSVTPSTGSWLAPEWTIGNLANGASATLTVVATVNASGSYANTATIAGNETDPVASNNTSTVTPVPVPITDLAVTKVANNMTPNVGSSVTFTITATNNGPSNATGVVVTDAIPAGYSVTSVTPSTGSWLAPEWTIGNLANGASATLTVVATVTKTMSYTNTATIIGNETDPNNLNNTSSVTPNVNDLPLAIHDANATSENTVVNGNVLANDILSNDGGNTVVVTINPVNGIVTLNPATGAYIYTPNNGFIGNDFFVYNLCDTDGDCDTAIVRISILPSSLNAACSLVANESCVGANNGSANVNVTGGTAPYTYLWSNNATTATITGLSAGLYTVVVKDALNVERTCNVNVIAAGIVPPSAVNVPDPQQCVGSNIVTFFVNSFTNDTRYYYNFGNGNIDSNSAASIIYSYPTHGVFNYTVTAKDTITGCSSSFNGSVTIWPEPTMNVTLATADVQCLNGNTFVFKNTSNIASGSISNYYWTFGDGNDSLVINNDSMVYSYQNAGSYSAYVYATSNNNCSNIDTINLVVNPSATANFTFNDVACDASRNAIFSNTSSNATGYIWNFGDNNTSLNTNPTHVYTSNGNYNVTLIAYTSFGCNDTLTQPLGIAVVENADFTYSILTCSNDVNFNNLTSGNNTYEWDFGNGNASTDFHPVNTYLIDGIYQVTLIATSNLGCKDTITKPVNYQYIQPTALFSYNILDCDGNVEFTNLSSNAIEYIWNFETGVVCTYDINGVTRNFGPGSYFVSLIAKGLSANCADTFALNIVVPPKPIAIFSSQPQMCTRNVSFKNYSFFATNYDWNFGDPAAGLANSSALAEPTHTFTANGTYIVRLIAMTGGCQDTIYDTIDVSDVGIMPVAAFSHTDISSSCSNLIQFNNQSNEAVNYIWLFHDSSTINFSDPTKAYPLAGNYKVTLFAVSASGCVDSVSHMVNIAQDRDGALATFTVNDSVQCLNENRFHFYNNSVYYGNSWIPKYYWDFGDGTFDTTNTFIFNKKYDTAGVYTVRLVAVSVSGCRDTAYQTVRVKPSAKPNFFAGTICTMTAQITNSSNDDNIISFLWNYGENNNYVVNNSNFHTYTYSNTGWHIISLIAVAQNGCHDTVTVPVFPFNGDKPTADFEWDTLACSGAIKFKSTSWGATEFQWFFDDGTPVFYGYDPVHPYSVAGLYNVMLIASNGPGCIDTVYKQVAAPVGVDAIIPDADFKYEVVPCLNIVSLINNSYQATAYRWFLNDSLIATTTNATINNLAAGGHKLTLVALNGICSDTMHQYIVIQEKPTADFAYLSNSCSRTIVFNSVSQNAITYSWNFGDPMSGNNSAVGSTAAHTFMNNGTYFVKLVVENNSGCADSIIKPVAVNGNINPIRASFNYNYNTCDCPNSNKIEFDNTSQGNGLSYLWNFGDGRTSTQRSPNKGYADTGWFTVTLLAYDANGCAATTSAMVYIPPTAHGVSAGFTTDVQRQCITSNNFNFYNTSVYLGAGSWINKYYWYFGDGTTDFTNTSTFNKQYAAPGTYTVMLVAEALNGCRDTMTMNVVVEAVPCTGVVFANNNSPYTKINFGTNPALTETPVTTGAKEITNSQNGIVLYPNPTAGNFTIRYNKPLSGDITVKVYDMFGKTLYFQSEKQMGAENMQINSEGLADGKYFVVLYRNGEFVGKESVVIIH